MFTVQTVAHKTADTRHPVIMLTNRDGYKYFFGQIPEGTQRVLNENRIRLGKLKSVFFTGTLNSWSQVGGLPGLFLTLSDATKNGIDIFVGSKSIYSYLVATWRSFVFRRGVQLKINQVQQEGFVGDSNVIVNAIKIKRKNCEISDSQDGISPFSSSLSKLISLMFPLDTSKANSSDPTSYKTDPSETEIHTHVGLPRPSKPEVCDQESVSYIVSFVPVRGKFDVNKAKELGLKPGAKFAQLARGETVTNDEGVTIRPEQVLEKEQTFPRFVVLDIPNMDYLENTIADERWFAEDVGLVYHLLGDDVDFESPQYREFMQRFPEKCHHVISHAKTSANTLVFKRAAIDLLTLKSVHNNNFNLPVLEVPGTDSRFLLGNQQLHISTSGIQYDDSAVGKDTWSSIFDEHVAPLNITSDKHAIINSPPISLDIDATKSLKDQVNVVTLGTGSAIPSLQRNVISQLVRLPMVNESGAIEVRSVLLDGGENTLGAILRNYSHSPEQLQQVFSELGMIHLSHLHADHHLGIMSVINKWFEFNQNNDKKLYLIVPWQYDRFVREWYRIEQHIDTSRLVYVSCEDFLPDRRPEFQQQTLGTFERRFDDNDMGRSVPRAKLQPRNDEVIAMLKKDLGISNIRTTRALHCAWAYSISIDFVLSDQETFKVSYSGDTRPNPKFVEIGQGSDLLIHESSLDNDLIEEALAKKHSTMIEAVCVSRYMNCPKLVLTHFSSRYSNKVNISTNPERLQALATELNEYLVKYRSPGNIFALEKGPKRAFSDMDICFAFDMMSIKYNEVDFQKDTVDVITRVFAPDEEEEEEKKAKKQNEKREAKRKERLARKRTYEN